jgi:hypothetical protein
MSAKGAEAFYIKSGLSMYYFREARFEASLFPRDLGLRDLFHLHGEYSAPLESFKTRVTKTFRAMPIELQEFLHEAGYVVRIGNMLRDINPNYAVDVIPGSAHERTFEQAAQGVHTTSEKTIDLPHSMPVVRNGRTRSIRAHGKNDDLRVGLPMTMRHEIGHALNIIMGNVANNPLVRSAYAEDLLRYPRTKKPSEEIAFLGLSHYLPVTHGGDHANIDNIYGEDIAREEALVETMAEFMLAKPDIMLMQQSFPQLSKVAKFIWKHIQAEYDIYRAGYDYPLKETIEPYVTELSKYRPHF